MDFDDYMRQVRNRAIRAMAMKLDGEILGKPEQVAEAERELKKLEAILGPIPDERGEEDEHDTIL